MIGSIVTDEQRPARCGSCGGQYTQHKLTPRFLAIAREAARREGKAQSSVDLLFPDGWTPDMCRACNLAYDRRQLAASAAQMQAPRPEVQSPRAAPRQWHGEREGDG